MLVRKTNQIVPIEIDGVTFSFRPLSMGEKTELMGELEKDKSTGALMQWTRAVVCRSLRDVRGLTNEDGSEYRPAFDGDRLSNEAMDDMMNLPISEKIMLVGGLFIKGVPADGQLIHPQTRQPIEGIIVKKSHT
jgi:hypothetical protein